MPHSNTFCYEFGPFRMSVSQRVLTRDGNVISLGPKATDILLLLLRNAGELVEKEEVMREVWPDSFVEEANLTQNIFTLRRALGDSSSGARYIETVPRRGYRFIGEAKLVEVGPSTLQISAEAEESEGGHQPPKILAVLPFINDTGDEQLEYLASGVSDNIINSLSQLSGLRVMSRSAVFRYRGGEVDPKLIAKELRVNATVLGKITLSPSGLTITVELVDAATGWQLWGKAFDCALSDILDIQDEIIRQISATLQLKLTGEEEKQITARYTESSTAYQAYIEGRYYWSRYTKEGIQKAIGHFRKAITLDPNYALAYAGIIDCYLRLITCYLPPEDAPEQKKAAALKKAPPLNPTHKDKEPRSKASGSSELVDLKVKLRHEWDWKGAERELRRANELRADYPAAHQWHAAYLFVRRLYQRSQTPRKSDERSWGNLSFKEELPPRIPSAQLSTGEEVQVLCAIAREQVDIGNYAAACLVIKRWWRPGEWPKLGGLNSQGCSDLLFTVGELAGFVASASQTPSGQKNAEALLGAAIAFFEQLGSALRSAEGRIELAMCYYRQGNFDLSRSVLIEVLRKLPSTEIELRGLALIRLASVERHSGRLREALTRLQEAKSVVELSGPWATGRRHLELGATYKDLGIAENEEILFDISLEHHHVALYEFEAIGNLRLTAIVENNLGFLLLASGKLSDAQFHLSRAWTLFAQLGDLVRKAQVDDTIARLHIEKGDYELAREAADRAVKTLEAGDEDPLVAEALTTKGIVYSRLHRHTEAKRLFESAHGVAVRCGDREGSGRALLIMVEEMVGELSSDERDDIGRRFSELLKDSQQPLIRRRVTEALKRIHGLSQSKRNG